MCPPHFSVHQIVVFFPDGSRLTVGRLLFLRGEMSSCQSDLVGDVPVQLTGSDIFCGILLCICAENGSGTPYTARHPSLIASIGRTRRHHRNSQICFRKRATNVETVWQIPREGF